MRVLKWGGGIVLGLLLALVTLILVVTLIIDPNRFKGRIENLVQENTGRPFTIRGDLDLTWYPWLSLRMGGAQLGDADPLAQWESAQFGVRLIPLIRGDLEISRIRFHGLRIALQRDAAGRGNWEGLLDSPQRQGSKTDRMEIGGLDIREGRLEYRDLRDDTRLQLLDWQLAISEWKEATPLDVTSEFRLQSGNPVQLDVPVSIELSKIRFTPQPLSVGAERYDLQIAGLNLQGTFNIASAHPLNATGTLALKTRSLRQLLADFRIGGPRPLEKAALSELSMSAHWRAQNGAVSVQPLKLLLDGTVIEGDVQRSAAAEPVWSFALKGDHINLDYYVKLEESDSPPFELPTETLKALQAQGVLSFKEARLGDATLKNARIRLELDEGRVKNVSGAP